jgi:hypothetical protein
MSVVTAPPRTNDAPLLALIAATAAALSGIETGGPLPAKAALGLVAEAVSDPYGVPEPRSAQIAMLFVPNAVVLAVDTSNNV